MARIGGAIGTRYAKAAAADMPCLLRRNLSTSVAERVLSSPTTALVWAGAGTAALYQDGDIHAVIDGRIYSIGEVIPQTEHGLSEFVQQFRQYGFEAALAATNGEFAIALFDERQNTYWLARDHFGTRPLYYVRTAEGLVFASRAAVAGICSGVGNKPRRDFVARFAGCHYRGFDAFPDNSPYEGVSQLPAASLLCFKNDRLSVRRYWTFGPGEDFTLPEDELAEQYRELFLDAVRIRLAKVEDPAFLLSGGMDSSSVVAAASHLTGSKQRAFSAVYSDKTFDESDDIRQFIEHSVSDWRPIEIQFKDIFSTVGQLVRIHDEPVATATWLSHSLLCDAVHQSGVSTLFSGLGGDELNAGEYEYFFFFFADLRRAGLEHVLDREVGDWIRHHDHPIFRKSKQVMESMLRRVVSFETPGLCLTDFERLNRYSSLLTDEYAEFSRFTPTMDTPTDSYLKNRAIQDLTLETMPCCLRAEDRHGTCYGIEHIHPFLDRRLVEFMFRVPGTMKIRDGITKVLLREAMQGILPDVVRTRVKKTGWNAPAHQWFVGTGAEQLRDLFRSSRFRNRGIYHVDKVERLLNEHEEIVTTRQHRDNHMMFFWQLLNLEVWLQSLSNETSAS